MEEFTNLSNEIVSFDAYRRQHRDDILRVLEEEEDFEIVQYLGEGAFGQVIAVNCPYHEETVALKIVHFADSSDGELKLWPTLDHQNILRLLNLIPFPEANLFITPVMYDDMENILETESFIHDPEALDLAKRWLREVLHALDYLHKSKLCHLDIKADNVLVDFNWNAVLCDFSFISQSDELIVRYGAPIPYRPPETCLAMEKRVPVDGMKFDMWTYGTLALNVLTKHFIKMRVNAERQKWHRDMYPLFCETMRITFFQHLMSIAFPASKSEYEFSEAFNFVQFILRLRPEDRPTTEDTINHVFLKEGHNRLEKPDDIWIKQKTFDCLCVQALESIIDSRMYIDNFEYYKFEIARIHSKKARKWKKESKVKNTNELIAESGVNVSKLSPGVNDRQLYEKPDESSCRLGEKSLHRKSKKTVEALSQFNVSDYMSINDTSVENSLFDVPCGKDPSHMLLATVKEEATEKNPQLKNKKNKATQCDVKSNKADILDHEIFLNTTSKNEVSIKMVTVATQTDLIIISNDKFYNDTSDGNISLEVNYGKNPSHMLLATEKDPLVKNKENKATENDVKSNKADILDHEILLNTTSENKVSIEKVTMETQTELIIIPNDKFYNDTSDGNISLEVNYGKNPSHMLLATEKDPLVNNKENKATENDVKSNKADILDHEILLNTTSENKVSIEKVTVETQTELIIISNDKFYNDTDDENISMEVNYAKDPSDMLISTVKEEAIEKDSQVRIKYNRATKSKVKANKADILRYGIFLNTATENEVSNEMGKAEGFGAFKMETNKTATLSNAAEKGLHAKGFHKWIKEKINTCTSNVRKMVRKPKKMKEFKSEK